MNRITVLLLISLMAGSLAGCAAKQPVSQPETNDPRIEGTAIILGDDVITVDGEMISGDEKDAVYAAKDIIYYEAGKDFIYGEGSEEDAHSAEEAAAHTVIHITEPGTYVLSGAISAGQIAVELGEEAEEDPNAVVTLILNDVDITCSVAPAIIFYEVYECGSTDTETASKTVDTTAAGANILIADGTENNISGSYVARIYQPESVELSEDGTEVAEAKKLHKYDAAFYSKKSMNIGALGEGTGVLNINAENEGLDSELHLTINGGNINITSGNDGINTNEDGVSVTTINGGSVNIVVTGTTGEGDGIDSNGWLVVNGGTVTAAACGFSGDSGIDSDMGIHVNGGTVIASGHMLDRLEEGGQNYAVFTFASTQAGGNTYTLKNAAGETAAQYTPANDFRILVVSSPELIAGEYTFWQGEVKLAASSGMGSFGGGWRPMMPVEEGEDWPPEMPENAKDMGRPEGMERPEMPEDVEWPEDGRGAWTQEGGGTITRPDGATVDLTQMQRPENDGFGGRGPGGQVRQGKGEHSSTFTIVDGANYFGGVAAEE